jgi:hypothetical protein
LALSLGAAAMPAVALDTSRAEQLPGVRVVLTAANTPPLRFGFLRDNLALKRDKSSDITIFW